MGLLILESSWLSCRGNKVVGKRYMWQLGSNISDRSEGIFESIKKNVLTLLSTVYYKLFSPYAAIVKLKYLSLYAAIVL